MVGISGWDSSSISMLFSSVGNSGRSTGTTSFLSNIDISTYSSIKTGSYYKLLKTYYSEGLDDKASSLVPSSVSTSKDSAKTLGKIESAADEVADSAKDLYSVSSRTFSKNSKGGYDTDAIYKKVSKFASDYNDFVSAASKSQTSKIDSSLDSLQSYTKSNEQALSKIGITIDSKTGELSVDEKKFKSSDMANVKSLFSGTGSYAYGVSAKTSMIGYYAKNEAQKSNTYSSSGKYTYNHNTGSVYSSET